MDCYIVKNKYRCIRKNSFGKLFKYQEVRLSFVFKNYKIKSKVKEQIIIIDLSLIFPASKLVILTNKNSLLKKIKSNCVNISIRSSISFSEFNTIYKSDKFISIINLKELKIRLKEKDLECIFNSLLLDNHSYTFNIDNKQKILEFKADTDIEQDYFYYQLDHDNRIYFNTDFYNNTVDLGSIAELRTL
jgi:hypothetical protein